MRWSRNDPDQIPKSIGDGVTITVSDTADSTNWNQYTQYYGTGSAFAVGTSVPNPIYAEFERVEEIRRLRDEIDQLRGRVFDKEIRGVILNPERYTIDAPEVPPLARERKLKLRE